MKDVDPRMATDIPEIWANLVMSHTAPFFWYRPDGAFPQIVNQGSIFFVDAGEGPFAITATHVVDSFRDALNIYPDLVGQIGDLEVGRSVPLVGYRAPTGADFSTIILSAEQIRQSGKVPHGSPCPWPPKPPEEGKGVFYGGYRASRREQVQGDMIWNFDLCNLVATSVRDERIIVQLDRIEADSSPAPDMRDLWRGASGGPLFTVVQSDVLSWRLGGVLTDHNESFDLFFASRLDQVRPDGSIRDGAGLTVTCN